MEIQGFFTKKGLALAAKMAAGQTLQITRVVAGASQTVQTASALSQIRQTLPAGRFRRQECTAILPVTLAAGMAESAYTLRELGLYAQDPDEGEILYKVYRLTEPVEISPDSRLVLRFYLEETVSEALNAEAPPDPPGLVTEPDLDPLRDKIEAVLAPRKEVSLTAAELPAYIRAMPRLLTDYYVISVAAGTVEETVDLQGFYGPGAIWLVSDGELVLNRGLMIQRCSSYIRVLKMKVRGAPVGDSSFIYLDNCPCVSLEQLDIDGAGTGTSEKYGVTALLSSATITLCKICNMQFAVRATAASVLSVNELSCSGNSVGGQVYRGGVIMLADDTPDLMGGSTHSKRGGIIVKTDGTLL